MNQRIILESENPRRRARIRANLELRDRTLSAVRRFFRRQGYLEVETPVRIPAPAPEGHIDAQPSGDWYLQTSPELCMKRMLAAGYERIFQICKAFRRQERGRRHLPEMTLLEWYTARRDYTHMMDQCRDLIRFVMKELNLETPLVYQGRAIRTDGAWERLSVARAFDRFGSLPMDRALAEDRFDEIMGLEIEPRLGWDTPLLLFDYPLACGALARRKPQDPELAERFELYIGGIELCNGFSELTDPAEQRRRFESEIDRRRKMGKGVYPLPEPFLRALADMPPATGNALGLDRLIMLLADTADIDEVVAFTPEEL